MSFLYNFIDLLGVVLVIAVFGAVVVGIVVLFFYGHWVLGIIGVVVALAGIAGLKTLAEG